MMRFRLTAEFPATHRIRIDSRGTLEPLHAHNWRVRAWLQADPGSGAGADPDSGAGADLVAAARRVLDDWVERHEGRCFNDVPPFDRVNPTAEEVARHLAETFEARIDGLTVNRLEIGEAAGFSAVYRPRVSD